MNTTERFAKNLRELRGDKLQRELADDLGFVQSSVSQWESGDRFPGMDSIIKIADHFGVSIDYLLGLHQLPHHGATRRP